MNSMHRKTIAVVILTFNNNSDTFYNLLCSTRWMDEVIIVDSGSTDGTIDLAKRVVPHSTIISRHLDSFARQRNAGLSRAQSDWILHLDSDMVVSEDMNTELKQLLKANPRENAFHFYLCEYFINRPTYRCPVSVHAFHRNGKAEWEGDIDEQLNIQGPVGCLKTHVNHYGVVSITKMIEKYNHYSDRKARRYIQEGDGPFRLFLKSILNPLRLFFRLYWVEKGFRDGLLGFHYSIIRALNVYLTFVKIWEIKAKKTLSES